MIGRLREVRKKNTIMKAGRIQVDESVPINPELVDQLKALGYLGSEEKKEEEKKEEEMQDDIVINEQDIWFEAEHPDAIVSPFEIAADEDASNGKFIFVPNDTGNEYTQGSTIMATYTVHVSQPGEYFLWGRVMALSG